MTRPLGERANETANDCQAGKLAVNASFGNDTLVNEGYTITKPSQEPPSSLNEGSRTISTLQESDTGIDKPVVNYTPPLRRSKRKRRNA